MSSAFRLYVYTVSEWTAWNWSLCAHAVTRNFERIVVRRKPHPALVTDFVACVGCKAVYFAPLPRTDPPEIRPGHEMRGLGGPEPRPDTSEALKRDAAGAAKDYRKPGRSGRR